MMVIAVTPVLAAVQAQSYRPFAPAGHVEPVCASGASSAPGDDHGVDQTTGADYQAGLAAGRTEQAAADAERINAISEQCRKLQSEKDKARAEVERLTGEVASVKAGAIVQLESAIDAGKMPPEAPPGK
jgi:hypothetical protein